MRRLRTQTAVAAAAALLAFLTIGGVALAGHGTWTSHGLHLFEVGSGSYGSYADVDASDEYDFGHALWQRWSSSGGTLLDSEATTCGPVNEGCGYRKTVTQNFTQTRYILRSKTCANDGLHELSGSNDALSPCTTGGRSLPVHKHQITTN